MKPSRIICSGGATLRGLVTADTSAARCGGAVVWGQTHVQQSVTRLHPEGSVYNESDSGDDVIKTGPGTLCEERERKNKTLDYARTVDLGSSGAFQPDYRQCIIPSNTEGRTSLLKELHGFTINNETQMAFYTFWLSMRGSSFFFFLFHSFQFFFFIPPPSSC